MRILVCGGRNYPADRRLVVTTLLDKALAIDKADENARLDILHTGAKGAAAMAAAWADQRSAEGENVFSKAFRVEKPLALTVDAMASMIMARRKRIFLEGRPGIVYLFPSYPNEKRNDEDLAEEAEKRELIVRRITWHEGVRATWCYYRGKCTKCQLQILHKGEATAERPMECGGCGHRSIEVLASRRICAEQCASCGVLDKEPT